MPARFRYNRLLEKAEQLVRNGRIDPLGMENFNVIGNHGTYNVSKSPKGKISCTCPGYQTRGRCSHSTAVFLYLNGLRPKKNTR